MSAPQTSRNRGGITAALIALIAFLACTPMFFNFGDPDAEETFTGADGAAEDAISEVNPEYEAWFEPLIGELPGEVESGIFALQAGLGAGVLGFILGSYHGRSKARSEQSETAATPPAAADA